MTDRKKVIGIPEKTEAQKRAQKKYMENVARIGITMSPDKKKAVQDHADQQGESVNEFVNRAIDEAIERDKKP